ncbi:hypothetical protein TTRE_0000153301 [Trichuris trichiura]|uniref:Uncharacterized protein n=1 Tax=Trichuris trichiura TaxID=36087 RepID=A0A077YZU2_TRITR|nr:hypothetical protein TTRE_0000153301 [Trichuris trichiura]
MNCKPTIQLIFSGYLSLNEFIHLRQENLISRCCNFVFSLDGIKLGIAYIVVSIPTFIPGFTAVFPAFAGVVVLLLGICFVLQHFAPPSTEGNLPTSVPPPGVQYPQSGY